MELPRAFVLMDGKYRHIYITRHFGQADIFGQDVKFVEFKLSAKSKIRHSVEEAKLLDRRPRVQKEQVH